jgi:hypothetical protein
MGTRRKVNETIARAKELAAQTEAVLLNSLRTDLRVVRTLCTLAQDEAGEMRSHHLEEAETGIQTILKLTKHVRTPPTDLDEIEEVRQDILLLKQQGSSSSA